MPTTTINGTELFYQTHGKGQPLMLMHGGPGHDHTYFRPWLDPLGDRAELIFYDHRGNGRSAATEEGLDHPTWVADADALRQHLGHDQVILLGHSYGGFLAQEYALRHPERLRGLILCCTSAAFDHKEAIAANMQRKATPEIQMMMSSGFMPLPDDDMYRMGWSAILPLYFHRFEERYREQIIGQMQFRATAYNAGFFQCLPHFDLRPRLKEIRVPTLVISGADDWIMPKEHCGERLAGSLPDARHVVFDESGHYPFIEEPEAFHRAVNAFLDELDGGR